MSEENPYESPRHAAEELPLPPPSGSDAGILISSIVMSFGVVFLSGVATLLISPAIGDAQQLPALISLCALGLAYVWYSHRAVMSERRMYRERLNVQNAELHK